MILPSPFCVLSLESRAASAWFHEVLAAMERPESRPPWARWVLDAIRRTRIDVPSGETAAWARTYWFRLDGNLGSLEDLPRNPCPGVRLYRPGDDAPIAVDPFSVHDAQLVLPAVLATFLRVIEVEGGGTAAPAATPTTEMEPEPEPEAAAEADIEPWTEGGEPERVPEPEAAEVEAEVGEPGQEAEPELVPEPGSGADRRIPQTTTTGAMPLVEGMTIEIASGRVGWYTTIARNGAVVCEDISATEPWLDRRAVGRLTSTIRGRIPTLDQGAVREALTAVLDQLRGSPDGQALTAEAVSRVLQATETVQIELTDPPVYVVGLRGGGALTFSAREIAAIQPVALNERWLTARPREPLGATRRDFAAILSYWFSIAEEIEALGAHSVWEAVAEALQTEIAPLPLETDQTALARYGLYLDGTGTMWVTSRVIQGVIRGAGQDPNDPRFARYLQDQGILVTRSRLIRSGGAPLRAWGLDPTFKPESESGTLVPIPMSGGGAHEV